MAGASAAWRNERSDVVLSNGRDSALDDATVPVAVVRGTGSAISNARDTDLDGIEPADTTARSTYFPGGSDGTGMMPLNAILASPLG